LGMRVAADQQRQSKHNSSGDSLHFLHLFRWQSVSQQPPLTTGCWPCVRLSSPLPGYVIGRQHPFGDQHSAVINRNQGKRGRLLWIVLQATAARPNSTFTRFSEPANTSSYSIAVLRKTKLAKSRLSWQNRFAAVVDPNGRSIAILQSQTKTNFKSST
jgi:hypothetical protein